MKINRKSYAFPLIFIFLAMLIYNITIFTILNESEADTGDFTLNEDIVLTYNTFGYPLGTTLGAGLSDGAGFAFIDLEWPNKGDSPEIYYDNFANISVPFLLYPADANNAILVNNKTIEFKDGGYEGNYLWILYSFQGDPNCASGSLALSDGQDELTYNITFLDWCARNVNGTLYSQQLSEYHHPAIVMDSRIRRGFGSESLDFTPVEIWAFRIALSPSHKLEKIVFPEIKNGYLWLFALSVEDDGGHFKLLKSGGGYIQTEKPAPVPLSKKEWDVPADAKKVVHLIMYSHWDPDWLFPWEIYKNWTAGTIASAIVDTLKNPKNRFSIDTICFIKYFYDNYPNLRGLLKNAVKEGLIGITGGSVSEPAENLVSLEGLNRDIYYGNEWLKEAFNLTIDVYSQADVFGHSPVTPAWLTSHNFKYFYFGRWGENEDPYLVFNWTSPIGNNSGSILSLATFYGNYYGRVVNSFTPLKELKEIFDDELSRLPEGIRDAGIVIGADFIKSTGRLAKIAEAWNEFMYPKTGIYVVLSTFKEYFQSIEDYEEKLPHSDIRLNPLWKGFYASRLASKQYERSITDNLLAAEKALIALSANGFDVKSYFNELKQYWWDLSINHHHDTITGTSPDDVWFNSELERYKYVDSGSKALLNGLGGLIADNLNTDKNGTLILFYNNLPWERNETVIISVPFTDNFTIVDDMDNPVPFEILQTDNDSNYSEIAINAVVPSYGFTSYLIKNGTPPTPETAASYKNNGDSLDITCKWGHVRIGLKNGGGITEINDSINSIKGNMGYISIYNDSGNAWVVNPEGLVEDFADAPAEILEISGGKLILTVKLKIEKHNYTYYKDIIIDAIHQRIYENYSVQAPDYEGHYLITVKSFIEDSGRILHGVQAGWLERPANEFYPTYNYLNIKNSAGGLILNGRGMPGNRIIPSDDGNYIEIMAFRHLHSIDSFNVTDFGPNHFTINYYPYFAADDQNALKVQAEFNRPIVNSIVIKEGHGIIPVNLSIIETNPASSVYIDILLKNESYIVLFVAKNDLNVNGVYLNATIFRLDMNIGLNTLIKKIGAFKLNTG